MWACESFVHILAYINCMALIKRGPGSVLLQAPDAAASSSRPGNSPNEEVEALRSQVEELQHDQPSEASEAPPPGRSMPSQVGNALIDSG